MEHLEVIDLSSDDENSLPRKTVHDERKKVSPKNNDEDIKILSNNVRKRKSTIDHSSNGRSPSKKIKRSRTEDHANILTNLLHKKPEITVQKIIKRRIKPETVSPLSTPRGSEFKPATEIGDKSNSKTCENAVELFNHDSKVEDKNKSSNSNKSSYSFKINEGASSSTEIKTPRLTVKNKVKVSEMVDNVTTPSVEAFESFLETCKSRDPGRDMDIIISKFRKRYKNLEPSYVKSGSFIQLLRHKNNLISNTNAKLYIHISDVMDEMKVRQIKKKSVSRGKENFDLAEPDTKQNLSDIPEEDVDLSVEIDSRNQEKLRFLEQAMKRCQRRIKKCEEAEVDFDDENDSTYMLAEKYKERMVQLYNKHCALTDQVADAARPYLRPKNLNVTRFPTLNNAITSFINMKITKVNRSLVDKKKKSQHNFTDALIFPDYADILKCVKKFNDEENLQLDKREVSNIAKNAFSELGQQLQRFRHLDYYDTFSLFLENEEHDPALDDESLAQKLRENQELGKKKLDQVFQEYVDKQNTVKEIANGSRLGKEEGHESTSESSDGSDDEDSDADDDKTICDSDIDKDETICESDDDDEGIPICHSDDTEIDKVNSRLQNDAESKTNNEVKTPDNQTGDGGEIKEKKTSDEENREGQKTLAIEIDVRKSDDEDTTSGPNEKNIMDTKQNTETEAGAPSTGKLGDDLGTRMDIDKSGITVDPIDSDVRTNIVTDTSGPSNEKNVDNVKIIKKNDAKTILLQSSKQQTKRKVVVMNLVRGDQATSETASSPEVMASSRSPIPEAISTDATCELNIVERSPKSKMNLVDERLSVIAVEDKEVMDAPATTISNKAVDEDKETKPKLRLRPFAKPPGSWEDFRSPSKSSAPETQATGIADGDTQRQKLDKPTGREQNRFIKITKPIQVGKMVQVTKEVFLNLTNKSQINVNTVTNNVTVNFNNSSQVPTKVTSIAPKNLIKINDNGKIITRYVNVGVSNPTASKDKILGGSVTTPAVNHKNQMIAIKNPPNQVRIVGPQTAGSSKPRLIAPKTLQNDPVFVQVPAVDKNGSEKLYRIVKRPLGPNPQNIIVSAGSTGVQNQTPRSLNKGPNGNLVTVTVPNGKLQISNSIKNTTTYGVPRQSARKDNVVYETSTDGVPTYWIE